MISPKKSVQVEKAKQSNKVRQRVQDQYRENGIDNYKAWEYANTRKSYWKISNSPILARTVKNDYLKKFRLMGIKLIT